MPTPIDPNDGRWYQRAVFYEVAVRGFYDSDADGFGDFAGLTQKLDYLEWLGVDCLWLLPFYQSPLRDGGYDISDFTTVLPESGSIDDVGEFLDEAHRRGIRVIADMVMNHTSDQHPWFVESRQDRTNPRADWYVWNDDSERWSEARIIFLDTEPSNWTWDSQREQFYWHRFFHHQPDLNYDNPDVAEAMLDVVRFWLTIGLDGFRLDAVPYLFERDGTNGENLPETHDYLRRVRKTVDAEFPGRVLLAEANQWPSDVVDYFGQSDECHMCFHFPLMPRMFMSVRKEQRHPITEILAHTPEVPDGCQWGIFLRNHDELTLEMVTDDDRDYMYAQYATDPRMKLNLGIRRRLFPLLDNDERKAELFHALLFSMPGSPIMYYGDELGMGDNIHLGDRDGVRTPMQWNPDRNAGFSAADFAQLYLPPLMDPVYGYQSVNVEAHRRDPSSFLHWLRRMLEVRKQHPVLAIGELEILHAANPSVLAYLRRYSVADDDVVGGTGAAAKEAAAGATTVGAGAAAGAGVAGAVGTGTRAGAGTGTGRASDAGAAARDDVPSGLEAGVLFSGADPSGASDTVQGRSDIVLCVHNLSRFAQPCELMLEQLAGKLPIELTGRVPFPRIGTLPYFVSLAPYGFYWFELVDQDDKNGNGAAP